jgi:hypothetical protein
MLNDFVQYLNNAPHCSKTRGIQIAKELLGENLPYVVEKRMSGEVIIFNDHFIDTTLEALTTDCIAKMNTAEQNVLFDYLEYLNSLWNGYEYEHPYGTKKEVVEALDKWIIDEVQCNGHDEVNACWNQKFTRSSCN